MFLRLVMFLVGAVLLAGFICFFLRVLYLGLREMFKPQGMENKPVEQGETRDSQTEGETK